MIIKESVDIAEMLIERYDDIQKFGPNMRMYVVGQIMELYHKLREAEGCRTEYDCGWTTDERKEQVKREFEQHIGYAEVLADFIDRELKRTKESVADGYLDFAVMNEMTTLEEQKQYIDDVMSRQG